MGMQIAHTQSLLQHTGCLPAAALLLVAVISSGLHRSDSESVDCVPNEGGGDECTTRGRGVVERPRKTANDVPATRG